MQTGPYPSGMDTRKAFRHCLEVARRHYENFPVASIFIPWDLRPHVAAIYAFARAADDMADEGTDPPAARLERLDAWERRLDACYRGEPDHPVFVALADTVRRYDISRKPLADLLQAFRMDVTRTRYDRFEDLMEYCRHSANPIGHLVLSLFDKAGERNGELSDLICTALQLTNFWQDVSLDWEKGRLYVPLEDLARFGYTEDDLRHAVADDRFRRLMEFEVSRTREMFRTGKELLSHVGGALRFELLLTYRGGMAVLDAIENQGYAVLSDRPVLSAWDKISIGLSAMLRRMP
ncbi:MAG: squalene synthase HpnC [Bacteroidota bacterium]